MSFRIVVCFALALASAQSLAEVPYNPRCTPLQGQLGQDYFDFMDPASRSHVEIVEKYHFTPEIENLQHGLTGEIPGELNFVLSALPNHYRALTAMGRWQQMHSKMANQLEGRVFTADCYYKRALSVWEKDPNLHTLFGIYLHQINQLDQAGRQYDRAEELGSNNAELYYNHGLLKLKQGDVAAAQRYADKAYGLGYPLPGLRNKLAKAKGTAPTSK